MFEFDDYEVALFWRRFEEGYDLKVMSGIMLGFQCSVSPQLPYTHSTQMYMYTVIIYSSSSNTHLYLFKFECKLTNHVSISIMCNNYVIMFKDVCKGHVSVSDFSRHSTH